MNLKEKIRVIENFPVEGISFKDITTLLKDAEALNECINQMAERFKDVKIDLIVGPESRGFICYTSCIFVENRFCSCKKAREASCRNS